ncbi:DUF7857 domain-containing protein [Halosimplex amylolyticum]|uniref:DUF7857 domain-containing protein n=1 Tax=Halosimplex amylolyticum TaxID=3396616 RepID=UPI003F572C2C
MVTLDWSLERSDGVTLVGLVVAAERPCRVRIENRLEGPVWPPRRRGRPADGWEDGVFTGEVPAEGRLTVGYATPASPADPPAEVVETEPASDREREGVDQTARASPVPAVGSTPADVVRALGDPVVPRDSVPVPEIPHAEPEGSPGASAGGDRSGPSVHRERVDEPNAANERPRPESQQSDRAETTEERVEASRLVVPSGVRAWLADVEARLDAGERGDESDHQPTESTLASARAVDRGALRQVRRRADALLARAEGEGPSQCSPERRETAATGGDTVGR